MANIYIGTSGWMYKAWGENFYPKEVKGKEMLRYFSNYYNTVELNSAFYRIPKREYFEHWREMTPIGFVFAVKTNRTITHIKHLIEVDEITKEFLSRAAILEEKLGPVLIQLPPWFKYNKKILTNFLRLLKTTKKELKKDIRFALEPRHESWFKENIEEVKTILKKNGIALVFAHSFKIPSAEASDKNITADFIYVRLHGPKQFAASAYRAELLKSWATKIRKWDKKNLDVYLYFNNDVHGYAITDSRILKDLLKL